MADPLLPRFPRAPYLGAGRLRTLWKGVCISPRFPGMQREGCVAQPVHWVLSLPQSCCRTLQQRADSAAAWVAVVWLRANSCVSPRRQGRLTGQSPDGRAPALPAPTLPTLCREMELAGIGQPGSREEGWGCAVTASAENQSWEQPPSRAPG